MALIKCSECGREISDKAASCPGCGVPIAAGAASSQPPSRVSYNASEGLFTGTMALMVKLAMKAVQELGWKLDQANESIGLVTFETGMSWGSWSGVSCSLNIEEVSEHTYRVTGTGKQNVRGGQLGAIDFGEAKKKANKAVTTMQALAQNSAPQGA